MAKTLAMPHTSTCLRRARSNLIALGAVVLLALPAVAQNAEQQWQDLRNQLSTALEQGQADRARTLAEQTLDFAEDTFGPNHPHTLTSLRETADAAFAAGDGDGAASLLALAVQRAKGALGPGNADTIELMRVSADLEEQRNNVGGALQIYEQLQGAVAVDGGPGAGSELALDISLHHSQLLDRAGRLDESVDLLEQTCGGMKTTFGERSAQAGECYAILGSTLMRGGLLNDAKSAFATAVGIQSTALGADHVEVIRTRAQAAEVERLAGAFVVAVRELEQLRSAAQRARDDDLTMQVGVYLARGYEDAGRYEDALKLNVSAYQYWLNKEGEVSPSTLAALNFVAGVKAKMGLINQAEAEYQAALDGYRQLYGNQDASTIAVMNNLGVVLEQAGLYDEAEPVLREALNLSERVLAPAHPTTLRNMNNLALLYESQGNFERAESLYVTALQVLRAELGEAHPDVVAVTNNLAYLYMLQQDYPRAASMFGRAVDSWTESLGADHQFTLKARNNLGRVYLLMDKVSEAEQAITQTLQLRRQRLGANHIDTLRSMLDLGAVFFAQKRYDQAEQILRDALRLDEKVLGEQHPYTFETLNTLANLMFAQGRKDETIKLRALGFARRTQFLDRMLWVASENGREGYVRLHRPELEKYLQVIEGLGSEAAGREVINVSLQRKGLLLRISSQIQQIAKLGLEPALTDTAAGLTQARKDLAARTLAGPQDGSEDDHLRQIRELERRVEELEGALGRASVLYREKTVDVGLADLFKVLPDDSTLIDFLAFDGEAGDQRLTAGIATKAGGAVRTVQVNYDYAKIAGAIRDYREAIQDEGASADEVREVGQALYALLWQPLLPHLANGAVYLVPDGSLNILPFDALPDEQGRYLLTTTDLHILSSARDLLPSDIPVLRNGKIMVLAGPDYDTEEVAGSEVLAEARSRRSAQREGGATLASNTRGRVRTEVLRGLSLSDLDSRSAALKASLRAASTGMRGLRFSPLPGAEQEGRLINEQTQKAKLPGQLFTKIAAEEQVINGLVEPPRVLHIATHGFFLDPNDELRRRLLAMQRGSNTTVPPPGDNPLLRAGLAFAGINSNAPFLGEIDTGNDGVLTALEVLSLNLSGTELAVLSACETGLGEIRYGEGVYGLRRAFKEAGVSEIAMSLWEVSDAGTQALMTGMYERLLKGDSPRAALRGAQRAMLDDPQWNYPYIWAAFTVVGK